MRLIVQLLAPAPERPIIDERQQHPHIFRNGVVRPDEVESLFKMSVLRFRRCVDV